MQALFVKFIIFFIVISIATIYLNKQKIKSTKIEIKQTKNIVIKIDEETIRIILYNNDTVNKLYLELPLETKINITTDDKIVIETKLDIKNNLDNIKEVRKGDIVLDEENNIIIFLEDMECNKNYSKIGKILLINKLDFIKDSTNKTIMFDKG